MVPLARLAFPHLNAVAIATWRFLGPVIAVTISHGITVLHNHGEFLINKVEAVIAIPPSTASIELGGVTKTGFLIMYAKTVGIFTVALAPVGVVVVVGVAVEKIMTAARFCPPFVYEESRTRIVVAFHLFQNNVPASRHVNARVRIVLHGNVANFNPLQVQVTGVNQNTSGIFQVRR